MRDANRGGCSQSCRWKYDLYDMPFGKERKSLQGEIPEEFSMSAVDMSMIDHIPDMIENGVDSLKIEGRMESIHYVLTVTNCYKAAVDAYLESPEKFEAIKQDLVDEMWKVAQRELATGFYYGIPSENEQLFGARRKIPEYKFVAEVVSYDDAAQTATIRQRNVINEGDQVEFYGPGFRHFETYIEDLHDAKGNKIDRAPNPMELLTIKVPQPVQSGDMVRALKEGLINLYKEDGTSVTVRGQAYGLRSRAGNFTFEQMEEGVQFAAKYGAKVYVAANMVMHEGNEAGAGEWFRKLRDIGIAAVIVSDPALIMIAATEAPGLEIHLSTQASATNYETLEFWKELGLTRVVLAREVSMEELAEIRKRTDVEIEAFVHGAMCISYSGRCTLSNHMSMRDANRGGCSQSCRWKYDLYDMPFGKERKSLQGEIPEEFSMSAVDMSMIDHIPDMIENGVDSLKIEGRMKSIHYVSTVTNCYKAAVDAYLESPEKFEAIKQDLVDEMWKVAQRELATGFYYGTPSENEQLFGARRKIPEYKFVAEVVSYDDAAQTATIRQRNVINEGDQVEFYGPGFRHFETYIEDLHDAKGNKIDRAPNPMELLTIKVPQPVQSGDMVRALKEGLINLYKEDGTSVTVRA
ncbi:U32 family peptidase [Streptococcus pneumoniae]|nr:U32 family peptidase [Streptococcus pneumoniae]